MKPLKRQVFVGKELVFEEGPSFSMYLTDAFALAQRLNLADKKIQKEIKKGGAQR
jgi:hypothetical protein